MRGRPRCVLQPALVTHRRGGLAGLPPARDTAAMVPRYTRPEMEAIWAPANRYRIWFEIEALAAEGMARIGAIRAKGGAKVAAIGQADIDRIDAIERETRHDVIAFLTWLAEAIGEDSRFV